MTDLFGDSVEIILGVDPGASGAFAFYGPVDNSIFCYDAPLVDGRLDAATLVGVIQNWRPTFAMIELVGSMPKQGVSSTFKFGVSYGIAQGVIAALGIPHALVTPGKWKRHFGLSADKEKSRARALQLWPKSAKLFARKKDDGRAEAALIALYHVQTRAKNI